MEMSTIQIVGEPDIIAPPMSNSASDYVDPDDLTCQFCGKLYSKPIWLEKHINDKHSDQLGSISGGGSNSGQMFQSPEQLSSYVQRITGDFNETMQGGEVQSLDQPEQVDFVMTQEQATNLIENLNMLLDSIISAIANIDLEYYSTMSKGSTRAMGKSISLYLKHSNIKMSPASFLMTNLAMVYGGMTARLPKEIRRLKREEAERSQQAQDNT